MSSEGEESSNCNQEMSRSFENAERWMENKASYGTKSEDEDIQKHLDLLYMKVEIILDLLPSRTANMLCLERFSSWYTDKLYGYSSYANEIDRLSYNNVQGLVYMNNHCKIMVKHYPLSLRYRKAFGNFDYSKYEADIRRENWNQDVWHCAYKHGIPPLNHEINRERCKKWNMEDDMPTFFPSKARLPTQTKTSTIARLAFRISGSEQNSREEHVNYPR